MILSGMPEGSWISIEVTFWEQPIAMFSAIYLEWGAWAPSRPSFLTILSEAWANICFWTDFLTLRGSKF